MAIAEVVAFASGVGFLAGNIGETIVLHSLTNKYNRIYYQLVILMALNGVLVDIIRW